ncbi:hypothetical protein RFI_00543 [Reticulomyxa filosa]|uniref:Protein kinase domain-containing protein n=1 Tax=Reticulomyxa filosa TaxID=46433 RepID=X6PDF5_RETFI|nr:hypothetical protein RFI_00543 [Reticulomyxa filosa]|eukprot:ETO36520.1 hypothetical protein RFI_00543 [Reticulomyxa filosa]
MLENEEKSGNKVDVWALGITAIEMATGRVPLAQMPPLKAAFTITKSDPPTLPKDGNFSLHFHDFVAKCLTKNPSQRPTVLQLFRHPWIRKAKGLPIIQKLFFKVKPLLDEKRKTLQEEEEQIHADPEDVEYIEGEILHRFMFIFIYIYAWNNEVGPYNDATMVIQGQSSQKSAETDNEDGDNDNNAQGRAEYKPFDNYGTMVVNKEEPTSDIDESDTGRQILVSSLFDGADILKTELVIPASIQKPDLIALWNDLKKQYQKDKKQLEDHYARQLQILDEQIH